jgi:peptidoglycan/xylan/chitin deacetylase (PgdA/CDA1 family)
MNRGAIACFHSVTAAATPSPSSAHVSVKAFTSFVQTARLLGEIVPLSEMVRRRRQGASTAGLIALTFDDAYAAILTELKEVIASQAVPISVFPVSSAAARGSRFWWDRIDELFARVPIERWRAFEDACGLPNEYRQGQPRVFGRLRPMRQWLLAAHAGRWPAHLEPVLEQLEHEVGYRAAHRSMTFEELAVLAQLPEVELGVHTVSHPVLPLLSDEELHREIAHAYAALLERFGKVLPMLAIPFGLFDRRTLRLARAAGMAASFTLAGTRHEPGVDAHALPRVCVTSGDTAVRFGLRLLGLPEMVRTWSGRDAAAYPELPSPTS